MATYLIRGTFTTEGMAGVRQEGGSGRREAVGKLAESLGGSLRDFFFAFGDADTVILADLPTPEAAAAFGLAVRGAGAVAMSTTVLLTPEQVDAARDLVAEYRPPGGPA